MIVRFAGSAEHRFRSDLILSSLWLIIRDPDAVQLSVASATASFKKSAIVRYAPGTKLLQSRPIVTSAGQVTIGGVTSITVTVLVQVLLQPITPTVKVTVYEVLQLEDAIILTQSSSEGPLIIPPEETAQE